MTRRNQKTLPAPAAESVFVDLEATVPAALERTSTTVEVAPAVVSASVTDNNEPGDNLTFSKTAGGNAVFNLGDEEIDDDHLAAMLTEHNHSIATVPNHVAMTMSRNATPVLYHERTEDAQNDKNFYSSMIDFEEFTTSPIDLEDLFDFQAAAMPSPTF